MEVNQASLPTLLESVNDLPPIPVVTLIRTEGGKRLLWGNAADNGTITKIFGNGNEAKSLRGTCAEWEVEVTTTESKVSAHARDAAGNVEKLAYLIGK